MDTQTQAQIYLSDQRGLTQMGALQSQHTFNFGAYRAEGREPFGPVQVLNDDTLSARQHLRMQVEQATYVVLLPVTGGLAYSSDTGSGFLEPGQVQVLALSAGESYEIENPYEEETINFLTIWLTSESSSFSPGSTQHPFDLQQKNMLHSLFDVPVGWLLESSVRGFIGCYDGRTDGLYTLAPDRAANGLFVFAVSGAFEAQNRLLHARDGLSLTDIQRGEFDFEALSNDAILLLLEISMGS